jgi:K+ transporter
VQVVALGHNCYQLNVNYGFKDEADIPGVMRMCDCKGLQFEMMETSFFIARQTIISVRPGAGSPCRACRGAADTCTCASSHASRMHIRTKCAVWSGRVRYSVSPTNRE